jgi:predicted enzyme related to lactoylglutathione lyase
MKKGVGELAYIIINTQDSAKAVDFWGSVLGRTPQDESYPYIDLPEEGQPTVSLQQIDRDWKDGSNTHIDIKVEDLDEAMAEIIKLGGKLVEIKTEGRWRWAIMSDPDNNIFCLVTG